MLTHEAIHRYLDGTGVEPSDPTEYVKWLTFDDVLTFMPVAVDGDVPLYISAKHFYLYSVFVPLRRLGGDYGEDLLGWNFTPSGGWGFGYSVQRSGQRIYPRVFPPIDHTRTKILEESEPAVFLRDFPGGTPSAYVELQQKFVHLTGSHWVADRSAYCEFDENGDYVNIINVHDQRDRKVVTVQRNSLDFYLFLTRQALVRVFDVTRGRGWGGNQEGRRDERLMDGSSELFARRTTFQSREESENVQAAFLRGAQVLRVVSNREDMIRVLRGYPLGPRRYETFTILDLESGHTKEWTCDPAQLGNYFVSSNLPQGTSAVFFRPDVLTKYKADPAKYQLTATQLTCRSSWSLQTLDINSDGLVFTYLIDLGHLPYAEQVYWKSFNVPPRGGLSERAIRQDFRAEWWSPNDPLERLKELLRAFPSATHSGTPTPVWSLGDRDRESLFVQLHYVVTSSEKEWADEVLNLTKVVIDGLQVKALRRIAKAEGRDDPAFGSLKLLREVLLARGVDQDVATEVCDPLVELQIARSKGAAHLGGKATWRRPEKGPPRSGRAHRTGDVSLGRAYQGKKARPRLTSHTERARLLGQHRPDALLGVEAGRVILR